MLHRANILDDVRAEADSQMLELSLAGAQRSLFDFAGAVGDVDETP